MDYHYILGVDVSKDKLNLCLRDKNLNIIGQWEIGNSLSEIASFFSQLLSLLKLPNLDQIITVMEHTGIYVEHLVSYCLSQSARLSLVAAFKISEHLGGKLPFEEKDDAMDARRISEYGVRFIDKLELWQAKELSLVKLKRLQAQRKRMMKTIHQLETPLKESKRFDQSEVYQMQYELQEKAVDQLKQALKAIEKQIDQVIKEDERLKGLFKLIISVKGVGKVTAREVLLTTSGFLNFNPSQGKAFARYAGVVPGSKQSGKMKGRSKIPKRGNKKLKSLLTMGAISLINTDNELGLYYDRKIKEGKKHLTVINAMRNKLILRIFAVVRNQTTYQKNLNVSLD